MTPLVERRVEVRQRHVVVRRGQSSGDVLSHGTEHGHGEGEGEEGHEAAHTLADHVLAGSDELTLRAKAPVRHVHSTALIEQ